MSEPAPTTGIESPQSGTKRILFFTHAAEFGGAEKSLFELVTGLDKSRFECKILLLSEGPLADEFEKAGVKIHIIEPDEELMDVKRGQFFTPGNIRASVEKARMSKLIISAVADYAKGSCVDLIYCNTTKAHIIGGFAGRKAKIPVLWHVRDYFTIGRVRWLHGLLARRTAGCVITNSKFTAAQYAKHRNVKVVYSGINPESMKSSRGAAEVRAGLGVPVDAPLIGMVGRLDPWKGQRVFLRSAARIIEDIRDARFVIVGDAIYADKSYPDELKRLAADYGISGQVVFTGFRNDIPDLLNAMDIYVHPSEEPEPFGRGIVEAMLMGKPVIAFGAGGPEEIVRHAETGVLVEPGDSVALARAVVQLIDNPEVAGAMGENGRKRAQQNFVLEKTISGVAAALDDFLA